MYNVLFVGNIYEFHTPDDGSSYEYRYNVLTTADDKLSFTVKACNDAHIMLQTVPGNNDATHFEIVIGGWSNTRSAIRDRRGVSNIFMLFPATE
jgi:Farnesoic acid 0-methyl transferase